MELSKHASDVLDRACRQQGVDAQERAAILRLIARLPDDRVLLQQNVDSNPLGDLPRYSIHIRIQHLLTFTTFLTLAFTGLPIAFHDQFWAMPLNDLVGGIANSRIIHRTLAVIMILTMIYHLMTLLLGSLALLAAGRFDWRRTILPAWRDLTDLAGDLRYFGGAAAERPEMDKFMYKQKLHYFSAAFGNLLMVLSGSSFLFPDVWAGFLPTGTAGDFQELMRLSHPKEALLALLVIAFWHWYNVHLAPGRFPMQWTYLTGRITREHQIEEHFLEYLRCLVEFPEERAALERMLASRGLLGPPEAGSS